MLKLQLCTMKLVFTLDFSFCKWNSKKHNWFWFLMSLLTFFKRKKNTMSSYISVIIVTEYTFKNSFLVAFGGVFVILGMELRASFRLGECKHRVTPQPHSCMPLRNSF